MLTQNRSPNTEELNTNSLDSTQSFIETASRTNNNIDYCEDTKSSSEYEEMDNDSNQASSMIDSTNNLSVNSNSKPKKKKKKSNNVQIKMPDDDKSGIKLKIRRTNNVNQDENHVIVDNDLQHRRRQQQAHLKAKRLKTNGSNTQNDGNLSDGCNLPMKRLRNATNDMNNDSASEELTVNANPLSRSSSVGVNTCSKGTEIDESCLGACQAGTKLTLESVVLMETESGILIVSVQWRGKTLMGALMEAERFQIGSLEKDSIYRREKMIGMNRRNTRRKAKNLFGKKKRKTATPPDSSELGANHNDTETCNSDIDSPYICDKENCFMKFRDLHALRVHIYQSHHHRNSSISCTTSAANRNRSSSNSGGTGLMNSHHHRSLVKAEKLAGMIKTEPNILSNQANNHLTEVLPNIVAGNNSNLTALTTPSNSNQQSSSGAFSPAYSDISDANEAPVLENEAEIKPQHHNSHHSNSSSSLHYSNNTNNSSSINNSNNNNHNSSTVSVSSHHSHNNHSLNNISSSHSSNSTSHPTNPNSIGLHPHHQHHSQQSHHHQSSIQHKALPPALNLTHTSSHSSNITNNNNNPRHIFSPSAPQLQPEVNLTGPFLRLPSVSSSTSQNNLPSNSPNHNLTHNAIVNGLFNSNHLLNHNNSPNSNNNTNSVTNPDNIIQDLSRNFLKSSPYIATQMHHHNHHQQPPSNPNSHSHHKSSNNSSNNPYNSLHPKSSSSNKHQYPNISSSNNNNNNSSSNNSLHSLHHSMFPNGSATNKVLQNSLMNVVAATASSANLQQNSIQSLLSCNPSNANNSQINLHLNSDHSSSVATAFAVLNQQHNNSNNNNNNSLHQPPYMSFANAITSHPNNNKMYPMNLYPKY